MYTTSKLNRSDLSRCARLYVRSFNAEPWNDHWTEPAARKRLRDILDTPRFYGLIITTGDKPIGAVFGNLEHWYDRNHYNMKEMYVHPDFQGSGIGTRIMTRVHSHLRKRNVQGIYLVTTTSGGVSRFSTRNHFKKIEGMQMMRIPKSSITTPHKRPVGSNMFIAASAPSPGSLGESWTSHGITSIECMGAHLCGSAPWAKTPRPPTAPGAPPGTRVP